MVSARLNCSDSQGFSLAEVMIAMGLLTVVSLGVAQLFAVSANTNYTARTQTSTTVMAEQKMEQLRSLTWGFDSDGMGLPVSDTISNLAVTPPTQNGTGLNPSPAGALERNVPGFVDYLDASGVYVGTGEVPPAGAVFVRRWSIQPLPTNPNNTLVFQVHVRHVATEARRAANAPRRRLPGDALLVTVRTRKAS
jgi:prepilin-type N-terminal cleavage/methylation domain-containing protein